MKKRTPEANEEKFYRLRLPAKSAEVLIQWGRIGVWVEEQWVSCGSHAKAKDLLTKREAQKRREGYVEAEWSVLPTNYRFYGQKRPLGGPEAPKQHPGQLNWLSLLPQNEIS
ncbi:MAG: WGR domain-containing protein [Candidatus Sericytochromatia bacterium]